MILSMSTQHASKCGQFSSGYRTGKGQFSFQSQRKVMPKNVQTSAQLHSSHMHASKVMLKILQARLQPMWTMNFQMFKMDLEKAEEPEIKLPTSVGSLKKQEISSKTSASASLTMLTSLTVWITTNWKILREIRIPNQLTWLLKTCMQVKKKQQLEPNMEQWTVSKLGKNYVNVVYCHPTYLTYM